MHGTSANKDLHLLLLLIVQQVTLEYALLAIIALKVQVHQYLVLLALTIQALDDP